MVLGTQKIPETIVKAEAKKPEGKKKQKHTFKAVGSASKPRGVISNLWNSVYVWHWEKCVKTSVPSSVVSVSQNGLENYMCSGV